MIRAVLLAAFLLSMWVSVAHADSAWHCNGIVTSSGSCIGSEFDCAASRCPL